MLIIRPEQIDAFQEVADASFVRRTVEYLVENHSEVVVVLPERTYTVRQVPIELLRRMVAAGVAQGREYGMTWESTLTAFVTLMFVTAPNFDGHPLIQRVLRDESVAAESRLDQLWDRTTEQNWDAVKQNYDPHAWSTAPREDAV